MSLWQLITIIAPMAGFLVGSYYFLTAEAESPRRSRKPRRRNQSRRSNVKA